jgi:hypothetical protein
MDAASDRWQGGGEYESYVGRWSRRVSEVFIDEAVRFPLCNPDQLRSLFVESGLSAVATRSIDIEARFRDFDDYWTPFLSGVGPAPGYCAGLPADQREALRARLLAHLSPSGTGPMVMNARAFAVRGTVPPSRS